MRFVSIRYDGLYTDINRDMDSTLTRLGLESLSPPHSALYFLLEYLETGISSK